MLSGARAPWAWGLVAAALLGAGCAAPPAPPPELRLAVEHRAGTPLGALPPPAWRPDADPSRALQLHIAWHWAPDWPDAPLEPLGVHARAVAGSGGDEPFSAAPRLVTAARAAFGEAARELAARLSEGRVPGAVPLAEQTEALPAGVTAVVVSGPLALELSRREGEPRVELAVSRESELPLSTVWPALDDEDSDATAAAADADDGVTVPWREVVLLDEPLEVGGPPAVLGFPGTEHSLLLAIIEVLPAPVPSENGGEDGGEAFAAHAARVADCLAGVAESAARAADAAVAADATAAKHRELLTAARAMAAAGDRRRAGVFLAAETGADLALDAVLAASAESFEALRGLWVAANAGVDVEALVQGDRLAWQLERVTGEWLARAAQAGTLEAELESVLIRHAGVAARSPELLLQFLRESAGLEAWRAALEQENRFALEDSLPGVRVRAFDWLAVRGGAPRDYDPLGPRAERQAALLAAEDSEQP